jgi:excisionase family DNA binding protein
MNYLTTKETAEKLGVSTSRVRQLVLAGQLHAERFGRELMISETDIKTVSNRKIGRPQKAENGNGETNDNKKPFKTIFDVVPELAGKHDNLPSDLSTNKKYLEALGRG